MLRIADQSGFDEACRSIGKQVSSFMRATQKNSKAILAPLFDAGCVPFPEAVGGNVYQSLKRLEFNRLNLQLLRLAMNDKTSRTEWECWFCKLFRVLAEMEQVGSVNSVQ